MIGYIPTLNVATRGTLGSVTGLTQALQEAQMQGLAVWNRTSSRFGEYNRYSKEHQDPISIDCVPVHIPAAVRAAKYIEYRHSRLLGASDKIRLLELLPARWSKSQDFIACRLVTGNISESPQYEALSYTWGTLARDVPIFVAPNPLPEGFMLSEALPMTPQLYAALKRLRLETKSRFLWVDQICIDQTNNKERVEQVMLMDKIYQQSKQTIIWLGEEDEHRGPTEEMLGFLTHDASDAKRDAEAVKKLLTADRGIGKRRQDAVTHFLNRDWFTRAWVFQKAVLSRKLAVMCGRMEVAFETFKRLIDAVMEVQYDSGGYARSLLKTTVGFDTMDLIQHYRHPRSNPDNETETTFLAVLFEALQQFRATNPQDLIYAFLAPQFQGLQPKYKITPDYDKAVEWTWTSAAYRIIADMSTLDILAAARGGEQGNFQVPSWVPDWSYCFRYARPITDPSFKTSYDACHGRLHVMDSSHIDIFRLPVKGRIVRRIAWRAPRNFEISYYRDGIASFLDLGSHVAGLHQHLAYQRGLIQDQITARWPDFKGAVLRTLLADGAFGHVQPLSKNTKDLERVLNDEKRIMEMKQRLDAREHIPNPRRWHEDYQLLEKLWNWALVAQKKVMFATKAVGGLDGIDTINMGLAASAVRVNDVVAVLHSSKVPIVLRPVEAGENQWTVISQCYMEGWMYKTSRDLDWGEQEADTFVLV